MYAAIARAVNLARLSPTSMKPQLFPAAAGGAGGEFF